MRELNLNRSDALVVARLIEYEYLITYVRLTLIVCQLVSVRKHAIELKLASREFWFSVL